jgi:hypothetical protein
MARPSQWQGRALYQTALREWAYATAFNTSDERRAELPRWLSLMAGQ